MIVAVWLLRSAPWCVCLAYMGEAAETNLCCRLSLCILPCGGFDLHLGVCFPYTAAGTGDSPICQASRCVFVFVALRLYTFLICVACVIARALVYLCARLSVSRVELSKGVLTHETRTSNAGRHASEYFDTAEVTRLINPKLHNVQHHHPFLGALPPPFFG